VKTVFADTFYWVALTNPGDSRYQDAVALDPVLADAVVFTTDEILTEFMTFFSADPWQRSRAAATVRSLLANPEVHGARSSGPPSVKIVRLRRGACA
jgi:hypothetical protein